VRVQRKDVSAQLVQVRTVSGCVFRMLFEPPLLAQQFLLVGAQPIVLALDGIIVWHETAVAARRCARRSALRVTILH
jgi:hypothetical protein